MILTKQEIQMRIGSDIVISPYDANQLNPNSYNLRLGRDFLVYDEYVRELDGVTHIKPLDPKISNPYTVQNVPNGKGLLLVPNQLYLAQTLEYTETKNLVPVISGRSSIGRLGINVHVTAGFGDVGFKGHWTLELFVVRPVIVYPGMQIAQIYYHTTMGQIEDYSGKYAGNNGVQASMIWREFQ